MNRYLAPLVLLVAALFFAVGATAQTSKVGGTLECSVTDNSGAVIVRAEVRLRNTATNQTRTVRTDEQGFFRASELPSGTYEVRVEQPGFAPYSHTGVGLTIGQTVYLEVVLQPAVSTTQVTVSAQPSPIDPTQTSVTSTVDNARIAELPVVSRNYLNFVLLAPGVAASSQPQGSSASAPLAASGFTFGGLRPRSNNLSIDGLDNNDEFTGTTRTELSLEIIREFQVVNNGLLAESGGVSGGSINVVTKTGTNTVHGDAFLFAQNGALNARPPLENGIGKPDFHRYRAGFSLGGPIAKSRTFYYIAGEQEHNRGQGASDIDPGVASAIITVLAGGAFPRLHTRQIATGFFPIARAETEASGKLNHQFSERYSLMLRYVFTNNKEVGDAFGTSRLVDASARGSSFTEDHALVGSFISVFGTQAVGDLRFQVATRRVVLRTNDTVGPAIDIVGLVNFGRPYQGNSRRRENHYQVSYTSTRTRGTHLWKAGATVNRVRLRALSPDGFGGVYLFGSLADFATGQPDSFRQAFGNAATDFAVTSTGAFVQDHWSALQHLAVDLGMRYDFEHLPSGFNQDTNNFSPRVGLAYNPAPRWVLRAGYGIFFDRYVLANLNRAIEKDGERAFEQVADGTTAASLFAAAAGGQLAAPAPTILPSSYRADPHLATPYSQQASSGVEYLLAQNLTASVNYLFVRGVKLSRTRNVNLLPPIILTPQNAASLGVTKPTPQQLGRPVFPPKRADPRFDDLYQLEDSASSTYHGLSLSLNRRLVSEWEFSAGYTLAETFDDASDFDEQPENPFDIRAERALSRNHEQQRFVFSGLWDLPFGEREEGRGRPGLSEGGHSKWFEKIFGHIEVAAIFTVSTDRPVNPLTGLDSDRSHAWPLSPRPLGFGRNSLATSSQVSLDVRVLKYLTVRERRKLDLVVEFFNLFNHTNVSEISPFFGTNRDSIPGFARPIGAFNARQVQFSIDFEF